MRPGHAAFRRGLRVCSFIPKPLPQRPYQRSATTSWRCRSVVRPVGWRSSARCALVRSSWLLFRFVVVRNRAQSQLAANSVGIERRVVALRVCATFRVAANVALVGLDDSSWWTRYVNAQKKAHDLTGWAYFRAREVPMAIILLCCCMKSMICETYLLKLKNRIDAQGYIFLAPTLRSAMHGCTIRSLHLVAESAFGKQPTFALAASYWDCSCWNCVRCNSTSCMNPSNSEGVSMRRMT